MMPASTPIVTVPPSWPAAPLSKVMQSLILVSGLLVAQCILFWPSLTGQKILLPVDLLALQNYYLPETAVYQGVEPHDYINTDAVVETEPLRLFAVSEFRSGRAPWWVPGIFCGTSYYRWAFSPLTLAQYFVASPSIHAINQVVIALTAGVGAFLFCRRVVDASYWAAVVAGWCYPLTGTFIVRLGSGVPAVVCLLPWSLLAVDAVVRRPRSVAGPGVAAVTAVVLISGQTDVGGQVLLASGVFACGRLVAVYSLGATRREAWGAVLALGAAWTLGILCSLWLVLPLVESARGGIRMEQRISGVEERPPIGLAAVPQVIAPDALGFTADGSLYLGSDTIPESAAGAYAGSLAVLLVAPLAWCSQKHRSTVAILVFLAVMSLAWAWNIPGFVHVMRLPGINTLSYNRFVFVASFSIVSLAAVGLDVLALGKTAPRTWVIGPMIAAVAVGGGFLLYAMAPMEPVASVLTRILSEGNALRVAGGRVINTAAQVAVIQRFFLFAHLRVAAIAAIAGSMWLSLYLRPRTSRAIAVCAALEMWGELMCFASGYNEQCDPRLHYPKIPALQDIARNTPGRVIGHLCLPANLALAQGLADVRGYDGVDPARMVQLLGVAADPRSPKVPYATRQWMVPTFDADATGEIRVSPVLDMLDVRYVVFRNPPPAPLQAAWSSPDYFVVCNPRALGRVFVPRKVTVIKNSEKRMTALSSKNFDALKETIVEEDLSFADMCEGRAWIEKEHPQYVRLTAEMETEGLVVVADSWHPDWKAYIDSEPVPILRANHALRGIVVPAGKTSVELRFEPALVRSSLALSGAGAAACLVWMAVVLIADRLGNRTVSHLAK